MTSQPVIFRAFIFFFRPLDPKSEKKIPVNKLIKKFWPYYKSLSLSIHRHEEPILIMNTGPTTV